MTTPGPWIIMDRQGYDVDVQGAGGRTVVSIPRDEHTLADVRLIAAAPQLLAALKGLLDLDCPSSREAARRAVAEASGAEDQP